MKYMTHKYCSRPFFLSTVMIVLPEKVSFPESRKNCSSITVVHYCLYHISSIYENVSKLIDSSDLLLHSFAQNTEIADG